MDAPITIGAYGSSRVLPRIDGGGTRLGTGTVELRNQSFWTIRDLHITNRSRASETTNFRSGVLLASSGSSRMVGVTIQGLKIDHVTSNLVSRTSWDTREYGGISAITASNQPQAGFDGLRILNNNVSGVGRTGIVVSNHNDQGSWDRKVQILGNTISRARGDSIVLRGSMNARIAHNTSAYGASFWPCKQCGNISPESANAGIWPARTRGTIIEYNEVYGEHRLGGDGVGLDVDLSAQNTVVQYNYVHDNEGGGILFCGSNSTAARFNILENNSRSAFVFIGSIPAKNSAIYNNTVYTSMRNGADVVRTQGSNGGSGITFFNNLIYNMGWGFYKWPTRAKSSHNTVIGTHGIGEPRGSGTIFDTAILRNPGNGRVGFGTLGGYKPTSPKDDPRGIAIPSSVKKDFFGKTINPKHPPRGAAG